MNWDAVGAIGQVLGSIAVFVTIGFLTAQMRDTATERRRALVKSRTEGYNQTNLVTATNERLVEIHQKANVKLARDKGQRPSELWMSFVNDTGLSWEEAVMVSNEQAARWNILAQVILYVDELTPGERTELDGNIRRHFSEPVVSRWFEVLRADANPDVLRYINNLLAQPAEGTR